MDLNTASVSAAGSAPATLGDTLEAQRSARRRAGYRHGIVEDVGIDPSRLGEQGLRILDCQRAHRGIVCRRVVARAAPSGMDGVGTDGRPNLLRLYRRAGSPRH